MKIFKILSILIIVSSIYQCSGHFSPNQNDQDNLIPLKLNNTWEFENFSSGNISRMSVSQKSTINNQEYFSLDNSEFIFGYEKLFYRNDSLFTFNRDSIEVFLIGDKYNHSSLVFQGRHMFEDVENIVVPAGEFKCNRITQRTTNGFNLRTKTIWFSYGIGPIMKTFTHQYQTNTITSTKHVLKSYNLK